MVTDNTKKNPQGVDGILALIGKSDYLDAVKKALFHTEPDGTIDNMFKDAAQDAADALLWDDEYNLIESKMITNHIIVYGIPFLIEHDGGYNALNYGYESDNDYTQMDNILSSALSLAIYNAIRKEDTAKSLIRDLVEATYNTAVADKDDIREIFPEEEINAIIDGLNSLDVNAEEFIARCKKTFIKPKRNKVVTLSIVVDDKIDAASIEEKIGAAFGWIKSIHIKDEVIIPPASDIVEPGKTKKNQEEKVLDKDKEDVFDKILEDPFIQARIARLREDRSRLPLPERLRLG